MANQKISALTALTGANVATDDLFAIVDTSATATKNISITEFAKALLGSTQTTIGNDAIIRRAGAASLALGAADAAAPVAQTLGVQSVVAGTSNTAGVNFTIKGSAGTGTGAGGSIIFQVAPAGSTGTAQNSFVSPWQIQGSTGHFLAGTDNTYDIGAAGAARPRTIYAATAVEAGVYMKATDFYTTSVFTMTDGVTAPSAVAGRAKIYVDSADGDLKIIFGDGTIKTIVVDT